MMRSTSHEWSKSVSGKKIYFWERTMKLEMAFSRFILNAVLANGFFIYLSRIGTNIISVTHTVHGAL